jgi:hypothetical protein
MKRPYRNWLMVRMFALEMIINRNVDRGPTGFRIFLQI